MKRPRPVVLLPVKAPSLGKSRLTVPAHLRPGLATAFALDALDAALATPGLAEVVVVTDDDEFAHHCRDRGVATLPDGDGLNGSLVRAASAVRSRHPDGLPVALCADLPCLLPADLAVGARAGARRGRVVHRGRRRHGHDDVRRAVRRVRPAVRTGLARRPTSRQAPARSSGHSRPCDATSMTSGPSPWPSGSGAGGHTRDAAALLPDCS